MIWSNVYNIIESMPVQRGVNFIQTRILLLLFRRSVGYDQSNGPQEHSEEQGEYPDDYRR